MARPAKPMYPGGPLPFPSPPAGDCDDGALSIVDGAKFLGISRRKLDYLIADGELDVVYEGRKPRVLKRQLIKRLERQRAEQARPR